MLGNSDRVTLNGAVEHSCDEEIAKNRVLSQKFINSCARNWSTLGSLVTFRSNQNIIRIPHRDISTVHCRVEPYGGQL